MDMDNHEFISYAREFLQSNMLKRKLEESGNANRNESESEKRRNGWAETQVEQETFTFRWNISNFSSIRGKASMESPDFSAGPARNKHEWSLTLRPSYGNNNIEVFLNLKTFSVASSSDDQELQIRYQFSFGAVSSGCQPVESWSAQDFQSSLPLACGSQILSGDFVSEFIEDDKLLITCQIWIDGCLTHNTGSGKVPFLNNGILTEIDQKEKLVEDLGTALSSGLLSDVVISTSTKNFKAHKMILSCRSPVFLTMFQNQMLESEENIVKITDFDENVVKAMLDYVYGGTSPLMPDIAADLIKIADKYDIGFLKTECENVIATNIKIENCISVLTLADLLNISKLKQRAMEFINRNKKAVKKTGGLDSLSEDTLADLYKADCE